MMADRVTGCKVTESGVSHLRAKKGGGPLNRRIMVAWEGAYRVACWSWHQGRLYVLISYIQ